jgi:hypothetical protein
MDSKRDENSFVHVGNVLLAKNGEDFTGVEIVFTKNVLNKMGAASILDTLRSAMNVAGWTTTTVMRVEDQDAQAIKQADQGGDTVAEASATDEERAEASADAEAT